VLRKLRGIHIDAIYDFAGKGAHQQTSGHIFRHTAGLKIKHRIGIQLTGCGAVAAFDVIGIDFEFRFGIHFSRSRQQQVPIIQLCIRLIGARVNDNFPVEYASSTVIQNAAVTFLARGCVCQVIDTRVVIRMSLAVDQKKPV